MSEYQTDTNVVPTAVANTFDSPEQWDTLDPNSVRVHQSLIGKLYEGIVDGKRQYVSDDGYASRADRYDHCEMVPNGELPPTFNGPYSYNDDAHVVHHDHYVEHVTRAIVVTGRNERIILNSRSGVVWWSLHGNVVDPYDISETAVRIATALSDADSGVSLPDNYGKALGGWHSSMKSSKQSELMNTLAAGDIPKPALDNIDPFPYAVKYGDTRNVCSQPASIYAHESLISDSGNGDSRNRVTDAHKDTEHWFRDLFDGERAQPRYAGFA